MARKRRSRSTFDLRLVPILGIIIVVVTALRFPGLALVGAGIFASLAVLLWFVGAARRLADLHRWGAVTNMYALSPEQFEHHVASTYAALGYNVSTTRRVGDQGIDVLAERGPERIGIQCKRTTETVSNSAVQEAYAGQAHYGCTSSAVVALGGFTAPARALAKTTGVALLDGKEYADLFHRATASLPQRSVWTVLPRGRSLTGAITCAAIAIAALGLATLSSTTPPAATLPPAITTPDQPVRTPAEAVEAFYASIDRGDLSGAYARLSPSFRKSLSFSAFQRGYATTTGVTARATAQGDGATVSVHLVATDRNRDGSQRTTNYDGYWTTVSDSNGGWLLLDGRFHKS